MKSRLRNLGIANFKMNFAATFLHQLDICIVLRRAGVSTTGTICGFDHDVASPGRRTVNTEPLPGSLVTVTSPPIMRASLRWAVVVCVAPQAGVSNLSPPY
jgi:hypothetical protein